MSTVLALVLTVNMAIMSYQYWAYMHLYGTRKQRWGLLIATPSMLFMGVTLLYQICLMSTILDVIIGMGLMFINVLMVSIEITNMKMEKTYRDTLRFEALQYEVLKSESGIK